MENLQGYFTVIHQIRGNKEEITEIEITMEWEDQANIATNSEIIASIQFEILKKEQVLVTQKLQSSQIQIDGNTKSIQLEGKYIVIGKVELVDIKEIFSRVYYIEAN